MEVSGFRIVVFVIAGWLALPMRLVIGLRLVVTGPARRTVETHAIGRVVRSIFMVVAPLDWLGSMLRTVIHVLLRRNGGWTGLG